MIEQQTVDAASGVRLIGGEVMTDDLPGIVPPGTLAYLTRHLLGAEGRTLLAGAKAASLLEVIPQRRPVDVLVRSLPDARSLAHHAAEREHLRIFCGGFERFSSGSTYATVVCLDGPEGLLTPDSTPLSHEQTYERLGGFVADPGKAILAIANDLGLDNMFRLDVRTMFDADDAWYRGGDGYDHRRPIFTEVEHLVQGSQLRLDRTYCAYPTFEHMALLVTPEAADDPDAGVNTLIGRTSTHTPMSGPTLVDVHAMAGRLLEAGMARQTAPAWVVLATRGETEPASTPDLLLSEDGMSPSWASVLTGSATPDGWRRDLQTRVGAELMAERRLSRDLTPDPGEAPKGQLLEALLRTECERGSITGVRRLVRAYSDFMADEHRWQGQEAHRFFAVPSNVVQLEDGSLATFDSSWAWAEDLPADLALARGLRDFARRMLSTGGEHPWQPDISPDSLVQTLLAMAGRQWVPAMATDIATREAEIAVVLHGGDVTTESEWLAENLAQGASQFIGRSAPSRGYREAMSTVGRVSQELHSRGDQVHWLEVSLRQRDRRVGDLEGELERVKQSASFRLGRRLTAPVRRSRDRAMARARTSALQMLPPQVMHKAERALRRL